MRLEPALDILWRRLSERDNLVVSVMAKKTATICKKCKRVVWKEDVGEAGLCCFCREAAPPVVPPRPVYGTPRKLAMVKRSRKAKKEEE